VSGCRHDTWPSLKLSRDVNTASGIMYAMMAKGPVLTHFVANKQIG
jgi:hypothetical protein